MGDISLNEITSQIDTLTLKLLGPLRSSKRIDQNVFRQLLSLIDVLNPLLKEQDEVPRVLTGNLWFIFTSILTEAEYAKNRNDLDMAAWELQEKLRRIYGPRF
jgi:hypothetical protein